MFDPNLEDWIGTAGWFGPTRICHEQIWTQPMIDLWWHDTMDLATANALEIVNKVINALNLPMFISYKMNFMPKQRKFLETIAFFFNGSIALNLRVIFALLHEIQKAYYAKF